MANQLIIAAMDFPTASLPNPINLSAYLFADCQNVLPLLVEMSTAKWAPQSQ